MRSDPVSVCDPGTLSVILDEQFDCTHGHPLMADREKQRIIIHGGSQKGPAVFDVILQRSFYLRTEEGVAVVSSLERDRDHAIAEVDGFRVETDELRHADPSAKQRHQDCDVTLFGDAAPGDLVVRQPLRAPCGLQDQIDV